MTTDELVDEIFERCRDRIDRGEAVDVDDVLRVHADIAEALRARFATVRQLDRAGARERGRGAAAADLPRVGAALGAYRIESVLGAGGMGTVYLARVEGSTAAAAPSALVAVKVFHPHLVARERFGARFLREAELGRRVCHVNVVRTLDVGEAVCDGANLRYLVMEHVEGRTLRDLADELGRVSEQLCRHVGREVAKGLAALHAAGAVHRDIKPENVLITRDHVVKVMDLGIARLDDESARLSQTGTFVGSLLYGAPEQFLRRDAGGAKAAVDHRADLHGLGVLLYELATGTHPFAADEVGAVVRRVLDERPRRAGEVNPQLSPFFEELVGELLEKDPDRRPASAADVARILEEGEDSAWWKERAVAIRRETRRPLRRIRIPRDTAVYGRDAELTTLRALFEKANAGDGQVVLVEGEAGIGKSRLVDEFVMSLWADGEDIDFLFGSYPPGGAATAAGAFTTAYRAHLGDDEAAVREALPQTPLLVPAFAALLCGDAPPEGAEKLTKDSIQTLFVHATRSFAARRTTIVLIDDLHFAPEEGRALFASLALAVPGHRILLVGGARRSLDEKWAAGFARLPNASRLPVERLGPKDLVDLLDDALKSRHLAEELGGKIGAKSDGNPFFVFEILRGLREGQFLTRKPDGTWITTRVIREIEIPPSIVEVIQARVSDLGEHDRDVLEVASCLGFEFEAGLLGAVLRVEPIPLLRRLGRIEKAHRLVRSVGHRFAFDHHQVQEVLYAGLSAPLREAYHASIGDAIEQRSGAASMEPKDLDGAVCVELTEHFLRGAKGERGLRYLDTALTHLESGYLNDPAIALADRALAVPGLLAGAERVKTLLRLSARLELIGRREPQRAAIEEALALARATGDRLGEANATGNLGLMFGHLGRRAEGREHVERFLALSREIGNRQSEGEATRTLGHVFCGLGRHAEGLEHFERSLALARAIGNRQGEALATVSLGNVLRMLCRHAEAREHLERSLALAREIGDRQSEGKATASLGLMFWTLGRHAEGREHVERWLALAREIGDRQGEFKATGYLGNVFLFLGRLADAREHVERSLALAREIGDRPGEALATGNVGFVFSSLGRLADAREHAERWLALAREIGDRWQEGFALLSLAEVASESGDAGLAERLFTDSIEVRRSLAGPDQVAESLVARGALLARVGRSVEARADLEQALAIARELAHGGLELAASAHVGRLPGGDVPAALAALAALESRVAMPIAMESRFLLWQATRDRAHLVEAKRLLDFMVEHAPPECRETMLANVRLPREIAAAWREEFPADGAPDAA